MLQTAGYRTRIVSRENKALNHIIENDFDDYILKCRVIIFTFIMCRIKSKYVVTHLYAPYEIPQMPDKIVFSNIVYALLFHT